MQLLRDHNPSVSEQEIRACLPLLSLSCSCHWSFVPPALIATLISLPALTKNWFLTAIHGSTGLGRCECMFQVHLVFESHNVMTQYLKCNGCLQAGILQAEQSSWKRVEICQNKNEKKSQCSSTIFSSYHGPIVVFCIPGKQNLFTFLILLKEECLVVCCIY